MEETSINKREMWSNRWLFVLAAAGSAVGLGNIWKFPYIAGENVSLNLVTAFLSDECHVEYHLMGNIAQSCPRP